MRCAWFDSVALQNMLLLALINALSNENVKCPTLFIGQLRQGSTKLILND